MIEPLIQRLEAGRNASMEEMTAATNTLMEGRCSEETMARFLLALRAKGETVAEVAGAAAALRQKVTPIRTCRQRLLDTCGTGGDGSGTFNISTTAALVVAAAGVPVAKHGNRAITSRSGSADVLKALGVNVECDVPQVEACLDELGICFCFAPLLHTAMRHVAPVRKKLGVPTIFNILGPLANPAGAAFQLLGVGRKELQPLMSQALALLGTTRAVVVHGDDGLDEVTLNGPTQATVVSDKELQELTWEPGDFGVQPSTLESLQVDGPEQSARLIRQVLAGKRGAARDIVIANAAAALWTAGRVPSPRDGAWLASETIDSGAAEGLLQRLAVQTNRP